MSKLDNVNHIQSQNLFDIIDFLKNYYSDDYDDVSIQNIMEIYKKLIRRIRYDNYARTVKTQIKNNKETLNINYVINYGQKLIDTFGKLPDKRQEEVIYLGWFILYYTLSKSQNSRYKKYWQLYLDLVEEIRNFDDYENSWIY
jgi:hypothetical protein